jgi:hypothetical protein
MQSSAAYPAGHAMGAWPWTLCCTWHARHVIMAVSTLGCSAGAQSGCPFNHGHCCIATGAAASLWAVGFVCALVPGQLRPAAQACMLTWLLHLLYLMWPSLSCLVCYRALFTVSGALSGHVLWVLHLCNQVAAARMGGKDLHVRLRAIGLLIPSGPSG